MDGIMIIQEDVYYDPNPSKSTLDAMNEPFESLTAHHTVDELMADLLSDDN